MVNRVGQQLGNYRLVHLIGFGPHTEVYLGEHIYLNTQAAIKVLQVQLMNNALEDFLSGARAIAGLMHSNIVRVLDFGVENNLPFLVLDYAPNGTLRQQHPYGSRLSLETILYYVGQIAPTLQYAHNRQLIHCDIRPENMLLGPNHEIMLSDFSMALITRSLLQQRVKSTVSTIAYMAPEQIEGKPCAASDQYALGCVVYEWLCGSLPSHTSTSLQKVAAVSRDVEQVVLKALARDAGRRFASILAFAQALQQACGIGQNFVAASHTNSFALSSPERTLLTSQSSVYAPFSMDTVKHRPSRRVVLFGLVGLAAGVAVTGGITWLALPRLLSPGSSSSVHLTVPPLGTTLYTYHGHSDFVNAVAWSPGGTYIASGSDDDTVQVWNATTGRHIYTYQAYPTQMKAVAWSPNGSSSASGSSSRIASASHDQTVRVWNAATGSHSYIYHGHTKPVNAVGWSPDGTRIASGDMGGVVQVWDATSGGNAFIYGGHRGKVKAVTWSPGGEQIASGSNDKTVQIWQAG